MKLFRKLAKLLTPKTQFGYSQFGEDLILSHLFENIGIKKPTYLDIGANDPRYISNTYYFYSKGSHGVLIEPNPYLFKKLKSLRPKDTILNIGIGILEVAEADFYLFPDYANGLSTFSEKEATHWEQIGMMGIGKIPVEKVIKMPLFPINEILEKYFINRPPDFISLDVEGLDFEILRSLDFDKYHPKVVCVETLSYDENQRGFKLNDVINFMLTKNYFIYADTWVNTIFCRNDIF